MSEPRAARRALLGAVAAPFFLMPLPLTLLAWDLYGGFAVHGRILLGLAAAGAGLGALSVPLGRFVRSAPAGLPGRAALSLVTGTAAFLVLRVIENAAVRLASWGTVVPPPLEQWQPGEVAALVGWLVLVVRTGLGDEGSDRARAGWLCLGWTGVGACLIAGNLAGGPGRAVALGVALLLAAGTARAIPRIGPRLASILRALPLVVFGVLLVVIQGRELLPDHPGLGLALTAAAGALIGGTAGLLLARGRPRLLPALRRIAPLLDSVIAKPAFALLLVVVSQLLLVPLEPVVEIFGRSFGLDGGSAQASLAGFTSGAPGWVQVGFAAAVVRLGMSVRDGPGVRRFAAGSGLAWAGAAAVLLTGTSPLLLPLGSAVAGALFLLPWLPKWADRARAVGDVVGLLIVPALAGPLIGHYAAGALPALGEPATVAAVATGLGALVGLAASRWTPPPGLSRGAIVRAALTAVLGLGLIIYLAVFFALASWGFAAVCAGLLALVLGSRFANARGLPVPRVPAIVAGWLLFYAGFGFTVVFKDGPGPERCADILERTDARVLLDRFAEGGDYPSADPYDVLPDASGKWLITTFKRFDERGGFVEVVGVDEPQLRSRLTTAPPDKSRPLWPERFELDPQTGLMYFGMLGIDNYSLWEVALVDGDPAAELKVVRRVPLVWEPSYPAIDLRRRRLVQPYLAAGALSQDPVDALMPVVEAVDLRGLYSAGRHHVRGGQGTAMAEYVAVDQRTGNYYVPAYFDLVRFALLEIDGDTHELLRFVETFHPTIGLVVDEEAGRLYATNCLGGTLDAYDLDTFERVAAVPSGAFPRDIALHAPSGRLHVGNYSDGTVSTFETRTADGRLQAPVRTRRTEVGPVLRGIGMHPESGRTFAASACGVFEVPTDD